MGAEYRSRPGQLEHPPAFLGTRGCSRNAGKLRSNLRLCTDTDDTERKNQALMLR